MMRGASQNLEVEYLPIAELLPYARNSRTHSDEQVAQIASSIREFSFTNPVLISPANDIIAGHGRVRAAALVGLESVPCIRLGHLTETQRRAYVIADNRLAMNAGWDTKMLELEPKELQGEEFNLDLLGFDADELETLLNPEVEPEEGLTDPDAVPENVETRCKPGDLWVLGDHRLLCGDSTNVQHVERLMGGEKADMVFTDPPYGISYQGGSKKRDEIANDSIDVLPFYRDFLTLAKAISKPGAAIYIWHASSETHNCILAAIESGWLFKSYLVWVKNNSTFGRSDYHWQHEPAFYGWGADGTHEWHGDRKQTTTWMIDRPSRSEDHPTMKPVELCERGIINSSARGQAVYEPFCGSGSTLIACEKTGRRCFGMELDPKYADVILARWEAFTGKTAVLQPAEDHIAP